MSRNPYHRSDDVIALTKSVLVFMDILGYTDMVKKEDDQLRALQKLYGALSNGRSWLEEKDNPIKLVNLFPKDDYYLKAFTDNIVIGWPIFDDGEGEFGSAAAKLCYFQLEMVNNGFFIRGALSVDDAFIDDIVVYGKALIEAHDGESSLARDPRIILTNSAKAMVIRHLSYYGHKSNAPQTREVLVDADGQYFLNYLDCILIGEDESGPFYDELDKHKESIQKKLKEFQNSPQVWSKFAWSASYHNFFCDLHPKHFNDSHKINVDLFRASPSLITDITK